MMKRYEYGHPFETEAVVVDVPLGETPPPYFRVEQGTGLCFTYPLEKDDLVYGLGETMRGINKRGGRYVMYNTDDPNHRMDMPSLYGAHNFLIVDGKTTFGAFFDTPACVVFEVDFQGSGVLKVKCEEDSLRLFVLEGNSAAEIAKEFLGSIGRSFLPPLWAFGFGQSRWGYKTERDFMAVADGYRANQIPLDYICMDIDYMNRFIDFTTHPKRFPDFQGFVSRMRRRGIHMVPIIDAGVKVEPGNAVYDEGVEKGFFATNEEGKTFRAAVWPGMCHFPDFFQPEARKWFGAQYQKLTDCGIEGFWNDMNEPSIFYSEYTKPRGLVDAAKKLLASTNLEENAHKNQADYTRFYHLVDGKRVCHHKIHNLFGALMTRAAGEYLAENMPTRYLLFSRASYIGAHRYGGIWTGDNASKWEHLRQNVCQMPGLNMCGFLYSGADTGGFGGNSDRELLLRWLAFSAFTPLMRNHSAKGTRRQENYRFGDPGAFANIVGLRYRLLPYLYSEFMKAALRQDLYIRPMGFAWPQDPKARSVEDQLLVGESVMIAPVLEQGADGRKVYLPEPMTQVRFRQGEFLCQEVPAGELDIRVPLDEVVFFIRRGFACPVGKAAQCTGEVDLTQVELLGSGTRYEQYVDDGKSKNCTLENIRVVTKTGA